LFAPAQPSASSHGHAAGKRISKSIELDFDPGIYSVITEVCNRTPLTRADAIEDAMALAGAVSIV
jgi:hypothetical protein